MPDVQPTVPEEAIEAAAKALHDADCGCGDDHRSVGLMEYAELALAAAAPVIEKQLRARLADEIERYIALNDQITKSDYVMGKSSGLRFAARIVRGEQP